jgi:hypothetical protein
MLAAETAAAGRAIVVERASRGLGAKTYFSDRTLLLPMLLKL